MLGCQMGEVWYGPPWRGFKRKGQGMADEKYEHGSMDITERERIFAGFITFTIWTCVIIFIVLLLLALTQT